MKKRTLAAAMMLALCATINAQTKKLPAPDMQRKTLSVMETYSQRHSSREYSKRMLSEQDLSDLLWAATGKNREDGHLTAPTAMNRQEVVLYVFTERGVSLYNPQNHTLTEVAKGDHRDIVADRQPAVKTAPVMLLMVGDMDKFQSHSEQAMLMVSVDVGIVCQNINIFCSAAGLSTVPRATMNHKAISELLGLTENQIPIINNPVGYPKE